jgi:hypothetical protein
MTRRVRIPVRGSERTSNSEKLQHGNDRLPKKRKERK